MDVARRSLNEMCEVQPVEAVLDTGPALYRVRYSPENNRLNNRISIKNLVLHY